MKSKHRRHLITLLAAILLLVGCNGDNAGDNVAETPAVTNTRVADDTEYKFSNRFPFDGIPPIYDPVFVPAAEAPLEAEELVLGITLEGEAKAYPVTILRFREMVNDELAGIPILASW